MQEVGGSIPPGSTICLNECCWTRYTSPSSRGLGHHPFTVDTGVRIPVGTPSIRPQGLPQGGPCRFSAALSLPPSSEEHTSELQSLMRISYAVLCLKNKTKR